MDVADWLRALGLDQYEAAFRENGVDAEVLPTLTGEELKDIGVSLIRHRRRLLEAIVALRLEAAQDRAFVPVSPGPPTDPAESLGTSETTAERRPLSVMFCDLIGSTALSARLDPEDLREVIRSYQARVASTIRQFNGFIARYVGDGVLIYFGWPEVHETDAERAVRAGLAVAAAVSEAQVSGEPLRVRIGIATGLVVIGEPIGSGDSRQQTAIGETPNLAARLQGLAGPNQVVIDAATRRQIGDLFKCQDLGTVELKGLPAAVSAWQVLGEGMLESRFEALHGNTMTPLIGREEELELLLRRWQQAAAGEGRIVLLTGEPGIGKSRLLVELEARLATKAHVSLRYFCSPLHYSSALHPIIMRWELDAGFARSDTAEQRLRKLESVLASDEPSPTDVALLAGMLGLPTGERYKQPDLSPQRRKEQTFALLQRRLTLLAQRQPVLMLFEDAHWADHSSLELLDMLASQITELPILLVVSFRPEFVSSWIGRAGVSLITLTRLDRGQSAALAAHVTTAHVLTQALLEWVIAQTDGVPLFIEELTKAILETAPNGPPLALAVPGTLQASLLARLDRLPAAKSVAQIGAVIGREFSHNLLTAVAGLAEAQLTRGLDELVAAGLMFRRGFPPEAAYTFKHALVQDAAYQSLLRGRRAEIHAAIVAAGERDASLAIEPGVLGHHCAEAGLIAKAANYYRLAGKRAAERAASVETRVYLERGLHFATTLPDGSDRHRLEAELLLALGDILQLTKGYANVEADEVFARAIPLCRRLEDPKPLFRALEARFTFVATHDEMAAAQAIAQEMLDLAESRGEAWMNVAARMGMGCALFWQGCFAGAQQHFETAVALIAREPEAASGDWRADVYIHANLALLLACLGYPEQAARQVQLAIDWASRRGSFALAYGLSVAGRALVVLYDGVSLRERVRAQVTLCEEHGYLQMLASGRCALGWLEARQGQVDHGLYLLRAGLAGLRDLEFVFSLPFHYGLEADALACGGRRSEALKALAAALEILHRTGEAWFAAELHRRRGELLLTGPEPQASAAEQELQRAISIAREQSAKLFELRAVISLARLWRDHDKRAAARDLLVPIYNWFTEGFDTPDLKDAKALLDELA
jgi:class 3 adenylate cyclase/predicted ATPase